MSAAKAGTADEVAMDSDSAAMKSLYFMITFYFAVMTKCARRFFEYADSSCPESNGNSLP